MFITSVSVIEILFLNYMYFLYRTECDFDSLRSTWFNEFMGGFLNHSGTGAVNRVCVFGKGMAILFSAFIIARACFLDPTSHLSWISWAGVTIVLDCILLALASMMNTNAFVYILPLLVGEVLLFFFDIHDWQ